MDDDFKAITSMVGRVGADPEEKTTPKGSVLIQFPIYKALTYGDKETGDRGESLLVSVATFNDTLKAKVVAFIRKGMTVAVEGNPTSVVSRKNGKEYHNLNATRIFLVTDLKSVPMTNSVSAPTQQATQRPENISTSSVRF